MKRDRGSMLHLMSVFFACMVTAAMAIFFTWWLSSLHQKEQFDTIGRKYLLYMETKGYCTGEAMDEMEQELYAAGYENLSFDGTTTEETGYGEEIVLNISGTVKLSILRGSFGGFFREKSSTPATLHLTSTAKH